MKLFTSFDIETSKILPPDVKELRDHRPLGICCACIQEQEGKQPLRYSNEPEAKIGPVQLGQVVDELLERQKTSQIVTLNGLGFDFDILAEESGRLKDCQDIARNHIDMMFHILCAKGYPVGLEAAAKAIGKQKPEGVDGSLVPTLWQQGQFDTVLEYVAHDCQLTLDVAVEAERRGEFRWITKKGKMASLLLPNGWLTVEQAMNLPLPDTSWMDAPLTRERFAGWLSAIPTEPMF